MVKGGHVKTFRVLVGEEPHPDSFHVHSAKTPTYPSTINKPQSGIVQHAPVALLFFTYHLISELCILKLPSPLGRQLWREFLAPPFLVISAMSGT